MPILILVFVYHPQTADPNGSIKCPVCRNDFKDIVTVPAKTAPQCSSYQRDVLLPMPSSMNPSGASVKTSPTVLHGRSSESDESDEDLHQEAQVLYILKSQNIESCISICVLVVLKKILVYSNLYVRSSSSKKEQKRSCHSC